MYRKKAIPAALRREVWIRHVGPVFEAKCVVSWCTTMLTPFSFQCGHDIPESKGGPTTVENLYPICSNCNHSMGNRYSIAEFNEQFEGSLHKAKEPKQSKQSKNGFFRCCFSPNVVGDDTNK